MISCTTLVLRLFKYILYMYIIYALQLIVRNVNVDGDEWRHRPYWFWHLFKSGLIPGFELKESWFLYGDEDEMTKEGLKTLLVSINQEAELHKMGKFFAIGVIRNEVEQRRCVKEAIAEKKKKKVPMIKPAGPPVVVVGLPRTSTTFLHNLLTQDEAAFRAPRFHEYMSACPPASEDEDGGLFDNILIEIQGLKMAGLRVLLPDMSALHHMDGRTPDEDVIPLGHTLVSALYFTTFYLPTYMEWLKKDSSTKFRASLDYLKEYLDIQLRKNDKRWLLKTPWHLVQLRELVDVFPGTQFIWTHRDPIEQASSLCSVVNKMVGIGSERVRYIESRELIANATIDFWFWALSRAVKARKQLVQQKRAQFIDVSFKSLNEQPLLVAKRIYARYNWSLTPEVIQKMADYVEQNRVGAKFGSHKHRLSDFKVDEESVRSRYEKTMSGLELDFVV